MKISSSLMKLTRYQQAGCKNIMRQLLTPRRSVALNILEENRFYLIIEDNVNEICFTTKRDTFRKELHIPSSLIFFLVNNDLKKTE